MINIYEAEGYHVVRPERVYGRSSLRASGDVEYDGGYREATPEELYGSCSTLQVAPSVEPLAPRLSDEPLFNVILVVTLIGYLYMMLRSWKFIDTIYGDMLENQSERRMVSQGGELPLQSFKRRAAFIGALALALVVVRLSEMVIPSTSPIYNISGISSYASVVGIVAVVVFSAWLYALHKVAEWLTVSDSPQILGSIGYMNFVRLVVLLYPVAAVWLLADVESFTTVTIALIVCLLPIAILYLKDTFLFFVGKKIPILYWILYICTAILLPLSFVLHILFTLLG
ncbi:MAG: DUF4271 domain-containing protein [Alistipes sp.]|nr:DUF4271 domain-containing protein [Alistipes sp.]